MAVEVGLIPTAEANTEFTRGNAVEVIWNALNAVIAGTDTTLAQRLILQNVFTLDAFAEAELIREFGEIPSEPASAEKKPNAFYPLINPSWIFGWDDSDNDFEEEYPKEEETGGLIEEGDINLT